MLPLALVLTLAAAQVDDLEDAEPYDDFPSERLSLTAWGGQAWETGTRGGGSYGLLGGEVAWRFDAIEVGVAGYGLRLTGVRDPWTPVTVLRLTERFRTARGVEASFTFGIGAARPDDWIAWFQVALGVRLELGPAFVAGEIAFEQYDLVHLTGGVGVRF